MNTPLKMTEKQVIEAVEATRDAEIRRIQDFAHNVIEDLKLAFKSAEAPNEHKNAIPKPGVWPCKACGAEISMGSTCGGVCTREWLADLYQNIAGER